MVIRFESLQGHLGDLADVRRPAVQTSLFAAFELEPELRRDHHLITNWSERFADELFVRERSVRFGGIEERDATSTAARMIAMPSSRSRPARSRS
jgi:hypothetical protein